MSDTDRLTPEIVNDLRRRINPETGKNYTQNEIARMFGVSRQYVSKLKLSAPNPHRTPRERAVEAFPWSVPSELQTWWYHALRDHAEYMATGGRGMPWWKLRQLRHLYDRLDRENAVVEFDPDIEPNEYTERGGFALRPRRKSDGDLIIRVNRWTSLTEDGKRVWRMPPRRPDEGGRSDT